MQSGRAHVRGTSLTALLLLGRSRRCLKVALSPSTRGRRALAANCRLRIRARRLHRRHLWWRTRGRLRFSCGRLLASGSCGHVSVVMEQARMRRVEWAGQVLPLTPSESRQRLRGGMMGEMPAQPVRGVEGRNELSDVLIRVAYALHREECPWTHVRHHMGRRGRREARANGWGG